MSLLSVILIFLNAYPWPMKNASSNFNGPLTVYATLGDARGDDDPPIVNRFHHGIDIVAPNGTAVYSIDSVQLILFGRMV
jgi:murein DD-endopeptidase MepM/ murein hydrolase activator NlpD